MTRSRCLLFSACLKLTFDSGSPPLWIFPLQKWKKNWFVLYPASQNGIARLEFFDSSSGGGAGGGGGSGSGSSEKTRKLDKKIIRLSECISILPALTEACPKENMAAFCVETNDKTHMFAAEQNTAKEWMETMCDIAFQVACPPRQWDSLFLQTMRRISL